MTNSNMQNQNHSTKIQLMKSFKLLAIIAVLSIAGSAPALAQKKTSTTSPCVEVAADGAKNVKQFWANQDYQPCREAIDSLRAASFLALGENLDEPPFKATADYTLQDYLKIIGQNPAWKAKFDNGLTIKDATDYLVESELIKNHSDGDRAVFVNGIFDRVYGKMPTAAESGVYVAQINARKAWFITIFLAEKQKLNQNPLLREEMVKLAFQNTLKRQPTAVELAYWKPRPEVYREITAKIKK